MEMAKARKSRIEDEGTVATMEAPTPPSVSEGEVDGLLASIPPTELPFTEATASNGDTSPPPEVPTPPMEEGPSNATVEAPVATPTVKPSTKVGWIQAAISALGYTEGNVAETGVNKALLDWICKEENAGPSVRMTFENGFSVAKGQAVKKLWGGKTGTAGVGAAKPAIPTVEEALKLIELAKETPNGFNELDKAITEVTTCLELFGGSFDKLKLAWKMIQELRSEANSVKV